MKKMMNFFLAVCCGLLGYVLIGVSMSHGAGIGGDATIYLTAADNLAKGNGLGLLNPNGDFRLLPYFPPLYSLFLAPFSLLNWPLDKVAMIANFFFIAILIMMIVSWMVNQGRSMVPALFLGLVLAASPILIPAYSWAMSEPLAMLMGFAALLCIEGYLDDDSWVKLIFGGIFAGLAFLTRYACAAFIAACGLMILIGTKESIGKRIARIVIFAVFALAPMIAWLIYDFKMTGTVASRSMLGGNAAELLSSFLTKMRSVFCTWILPESWQNGIPTVILTIIGLFFAVFPIITVIYALKYKGKEIVSKRAQRICDMMIFLSVLTLCYDLVITFVAMRTYPPITINTRMMLPCCICAMWTLALYFELLLFDCKSVTLKVLLCAVFLLFAGYTLYRGVRIANQNAIDGLGYHSKEWQNSETIAYVNENIPEDQLIVTNEETALLFLTGRRSWPMHEVYVSAPDETFYAYEEGEAPETDYGRKAFMDGDAVLVVFDTFEDQMADIYGDQTAERIDSLFGNLTEVFNGSDGRVYELKSGK